MSANQQLKKSRKKYRSREVCLQEASNLTNLIIGNLTPTKETKNNKSISIFSTNRRQKIEKQQKIPEQIINNNQLDQINKQANDQFQKGILKTSEEIKNNDQEHLQMAKSESNSKNDKSNNSSIKNDSSSDSSNSQSNYSDHDVVSESQSDNATISNDHHQKKMKNRSLNKQNKLKSKQTLSLQKFNIPKTFSNEHNQMLNQQNNPTNSKGASEEGGESQNLKRRRRNQTQMLLAHKIQILKSFLKDKPFIRKQQRAKPLVGLPRTMQQQWKRALKKYKKLRSTIVQELQQRNQLYELICCLGEEEQQVISENLKINTQDSQFNSQSEQKNLSKNKQKSDNKLKRKQDKNSGEQSDSSQSDQQNTIKSLCQARLKNLTRLKESVYLHLQQLQSQPRFKSYMTEKQQKKQPSPKVSLNFIKKFSNWRKQNENDTKKEQQNLKQKLRRRKRVTPKYSLKKEQSSSEQLSDQSFQPTQAKQKIYLTRKSISKKRVHSTNTKSQKSSQMQGQYKIKQQQQQSLKQPPVFLKTELRQKPVQATHKFIITMDNRNSNFPRKQQQEKAQTKQNKIHEQYVAQFQVKKQINPEQLQLKLKQQKRQKLSMQPRLIIQSILFRSSTQNASSANKEEPKKETMMIDKQQKVFQEKPKYHRKHIKQYSDSSPDSYQQYKEFKKYQKMKKLNKTKRSRKYKYVNTQTQSESSSEQTRQRPPEKHFIKHIKLHKQKKQPIVIYQSHELRPESSSKIVKHKHKLNDWQRKKRSKEYSK